MIMLWVPQNRFSVRMNLIIDWENRLRMGENRTDSRFRERNRFSIERTEPIIRLREPSRFSIEAAERIIDWDTRLSIERTDFRFWESRFSSVRTDSRFERNDSRVRESILDLRESTTDSRLRKPIIIDRGEGLLPFSRPEKKRWSCSGFPWITYGWCPKKLVYPL